ncbi:hypothetical protein IAT38_000071 [Cryptococcus sp. DSM 104549]
MPFWITIITAALLSPLLLAYRVYTLLPSRRADKPLPRPKDAKCSVAIFLGSGGHTSEMKALLSTLDFDRYQPRTYIHCHGDTLSLIAVADLELANRTHVRADMYDLLPLPRARQVAQPPLSTLFSAMKTVFVAVCHLFILPLLRHPSTPFADLLLINGPGTCVVLVLVSWIRRILGLSYTRIIYVESFARVRSLSLSGKLVRPFVDRFLVQWPEAGGSQAEHRGWLV